MKVHMIKQRVFNLLLLLTPNPSLLLSPSRAGMPFAYREIEGTTYF